MTTNQKYQLNDKDIAHANKVIHGAKTSNYLSVSNAGYQEEKELDQYRKEMKNHLMKSLGVTTYQVLVLPALNAGRNRYRSEHPRTYSGHLTDVAISAIVGIALGVGFGSIMNRKNA